MLPKIFKKTLDYIPRLHIGVSYELTKVNQATQSNAYARKIYDATHLPRFDAMGKDIIQKRHKN